MISETTRTSIRDGLEERRRAVEEWTRGRAPEPVGIHALLAGYAGELLDEIERLESELRQARGESVPDFVERWASENGMAFSRRPGARHMNLTPS